MVSLDIDKQKYQYFCAMLRYKEKEPGMDEVFFFRWDRSYFYYLSIPFKISFHCSNDDLS